MRAVLRTWPRPSTCLSLRLLSKVYHTRLVKILGGSELAEGGRVTQGTDGGSIASPVATTSLPSESEKATLDAIAEALGLSKEEVYICRLLW